MTVHKRSVFIPWLVCVAIITTVILFFLSKHSALSNTNNSSQGSTCLATAAGRFSRAEVVLSGVVFMVIPSGDQATVIINPIKIYKGTITQTTVSLRALDSEKTLNSTTGATSALHFQTGQPPYLLFLTRKPDGTYVTRTCDGSRLLGTGLTAEEKAVINGAITK